MTLKNLILLLLVCVACSAGCRSSANRSDANNPGNENGSATPPESASAESKTEGNAANGTVYRVNTGSSKIIARIGVGGLLSSLGHPHTVSIGGLSGEVQLTPDTIEPVSMKLIAHANTAAEVSKEFDEKDRQKINDAIRGEALESSKHPDIALKSTKVSVTKASEGQYRAQIQGDLTLHGVTRPVQITAQVTLNGNVLRAHGEFQIRHSDYQIKRISAAGGAVQAKEEIALSFDIVAGKA
jgi:polyisoprenoid-binding protein YceI